MGVGDRRVVVTGMGIVSCLGSTLEDVTTSLRECKSGIKFSEKYQEVGMKSHICGRPDIDCDEFIDRKQGRFMGLNAKYAFIAMEKAKADAGLSDEDCNNPMVGGILGQGGTSIQDIAETLSAVERKKLRQVGPYRVTRAMGSTTSAVLATTFKLQGRRTRSRRRARPARTASAWDGADPAGQGRRDVLRRRRGRGLGSR